MDYHCFGQTDRISITMEDFYYICKKYLNEYKLKKDFFSNCK